ncbi:MAG: hypothetical protein JNM03_02385 [Sphingopyxis sp.]|jgi:hypothetical protein|uniref:hypothetical protein n=1 Tax=unclassified Sphingopyxis TaxID=2614943 RepID=UPI001A562FCB|nr:MULTISPECIES: hypothetical protein [unclassified Sphingopyxis]MBL9068823.1 hypothetical protein [Sphingopyxis sp.]HEV7340531.1 hypothetical protein [Sphingopyxis sp.]
MKIFWSWQSDTPQNAGRHFVREVIADVARSLNGEDDTEDAERPEVDDEDEADDLPADDGRVEVDHDTYGVGGSPPIAETILRKIRAAAVFVADVTPITETAAGKRVPNPNVMIELGYALRVLEHERIVLVMNGAEGAALKYLPFDLRHWRAPIIYKLHKDAPEERRLEVAAELKINLRRAILPGLKLAEKKMREDERRTNRMPELSVTLDGDVEGPQHISQKVTSLGVRTLEDIKKETPLLPLPAKGGRIGPARITMSSQIGILDSLGHKRPVSQWTTEETEGYNRHVQAYYASYARFLEKRVDFERLRLRSFQVNLRLENNGTLPATDIDVDIYFPEGIVLYDDDEKFAAEPEPPEAPPLRPMGPGTAIIRHVGIDIPTSLNPGWMLRSTRVHPTERRVTFSADELKHNHSLTFDSFVISFATAEDIKSFEAEFEITANEPIDPITGTVAFEVVCGDD